ncbi:MAG: hypothetical protein GY861_08345 [bacterium]|nr:hypothetical protein [bacterium]
MAYTNKHIWQSALYDWATTGAGEIGEFCPGARVKILKVGCVVSQEAVTGTAGLIDFNKNLSGVEAGSGDGGIINLVAAGHALGAVLVDTTSTIFPYVLSASDTLVVDLTTAPGTTGIGHCFVEYELIEDTIANVANVTEST